MFRKAELTCFRQHQSLTVTFEDGVSALRGANEAGKTGLLEAMSYCLFGAEALREPLSEVVTWGHKESELRVVMDNEVHGVVYTTRRGKSGAEVKDVNGKVLATGQKEVKKFWETLLGTTAATCRQLMMADQQALRGALAEGPGAAIALIERLSNFSLIDTIIGLVQDKLPNGSTGIIEERIATLDAQLAQELVDETPQYQQAVDDAAEGLSAAQRTYNHSKAAYDEMQPAARTAQQQVEAAKAATTAREQAERAVESAKLLVASITPVPGPADVELVKLRAAAADAQIMTRAINARRIFDEPFEPENEWDESLERLHEEIASQNAVMTGAMGEMSRIDNKRSSLAAQRITQTACGLCGKDLANVPEVATKNRELDVQIESLRAERETAQAVFQEAQSMHTALQGILRQHTARMQRFQLVTEFATLDPAVIPHRWVWIGPDTSVGASTQPIQELRAAEAKVEAYHRDQGRLQEAQAALRRAESRLIDADEAEVLAQQPVAVAQATLTEAADVTAALYAAEEEVRNAQRTHENARHALAQVQAVHQERVKARTGLEGQRKAALADLEATRFNNELIKALRAARPDIANELWGIAAASISRYFSDIRGVESVFTRDADGFKIDGHGVSGLSGSTIDSLGLAIRMALTKMFLPHTSFMVLDEPAAACDDERESSMLGVIAAGGFGQTIIVSHSTLLDSFATQLIQL